MSDCTLCDSTSNIDNHHTSYEPEETVMLCRSCHQEVHKADSHELKPEDDSGTTTIEINTGQRRLLDEIKNHERETYKSVINRLIEESGVDEPRDKPISEARAREIVREEIKERVISEARLW